MPKLAKRLDEPGRMEMARLARGLLPAGRYPDGNGLVLAVAPSGAASWVLRYAKRDRGLGAALTNKCKDGMTLRQARDAAGAMRRDIDQGRDPLTQKDALGEAEAKQAATPTFAEAAATYAEHRGAGWDDAYRRLVTNGLARHAARISDMPVNAVTRDHVLAAIRPIWADKHKAARNVLGDIARVLDFATARDWRSGDNPAAWATMQYHLPKLTKDQTEPKHYVALPGAQIPPLLAKLEDNPTSEAACLRLIVLTGLRLDEARLARWSEVDLTANTWTIPKVRMKKGNKDHVVPLSDQAAAIFKGLAAKRSSISPTDYVFPGQKAPVIAYSMCLLTLRRAGYVEEQASVHGFRSSFRTWAADAGVSDVVAELCLAHAQGSRIERIYQRSTLLEMRRDALQRWADAVTPKQAEVGALRQA